MQWQRIQSDKKNHNYNMGKSYTGIIVLLILLFHIGATIYAGYTMFSDYTGWTLYHFYPIMLILFTAAWVGIYKKVRWCAFTYFMLVFQELIIKLFFGKYLFGEVFGDILFPIDLIFAFCILFLYKLHFGDRNSK